MRRAVATGDTVGHFDRQRRRSVEVEMEYDVTVYREAGWWMVEVPAINAVTQARSIDEIRAQAVSLITSQLDLLPKDVRVLVSHKPLSHYLRPR